MQSCDKAKEIKPWESLYFVPENYLSAFLILMLHLIVCPMFVSDQWSYETLLNIQFNACHWQFYHHTFRASYLFQIKRLRFIPWPNKFHVCERTCDETTDTKTELLYQASTMNLDYAQQPKLANNKLATKYRTWKYEMTDNMELC